MLAGDQNASRLIDLLGFNAREVVWVKIVGAVVADDAVGWCRWRIASSRCVAWIGVCLNLQIGVCKGRVRQAKTELIDRSNVGLVECSVVDEHSFYKVVLRREYTVVWGIHHVSAIVFAVETPGEWRLASRVDLSVQNVCDGIAALLAWDTCPYNGGHVLVLVPSVNKHWADCVHDDHRVVALTGHILDEGVAIVPQCKVVSVTFVSVDGYVSLPDELMLAILGNHVAMSE